MPIYKVEVVWNTIIDAEDEDEEYDLLCEMFDVNDLMDMAVFQIVPDGEFR